MHRFARLALVAILVAASTAQSQTTQAVPPAAPTIGASGGLGGGIAIPIAGLSETHSAGYTISGIIDFSAAEQPFSFRTELIFQRYDRKRSAAAAVRDMNITSLGASLLARSPKQGSSAFVMGGIAVYRATDNGTKPGVNVGMGLDVPLTFFIGMADVRVHYVLTEGKPIVTVPITLGARF
jgi:ribosomal protein L27